MAYGIKASKEITTPTYKCLSCAKRNENRCEFYQRPIENLYNKCFNHSMYHTAPIFREHPNLDEFVKKQQENL